MSRPRHELACLLLLPPLQLLLLKGLDLSGNVAKNLVCVRKMGTIVAVVIVVVIIIAVVLVVVIIVIIVVSIIVILIVVVL